MEVLCEIRNHVAVITLNRPAALNALSLEMILQLRAPSAAARRSAVYALLIRGAGDKAFCAGVTFGPCTSFKSAGSLRREFFAANIRSITCFIRIPSPISF